MPLITANDPLARKIKVMYWPIVGAGAESLVIATAANTDEKWLEIYVPSTHHREVEGEDGIKTVFRLMTSNGQHVKARIYIDFDIVDKETGEVLYSVRQ